MKNTVKELANETIESSSGISTVQGKEWLKFILETARQKMYFQQFAYVTNVAKGNKDQAVPIAYTNLAFTSSNNEAANRTMTEITNLNTVVFTPVTVKLGATIAKEVVETSQVDVVVFAREQMAYDAALKIDVAFATAIAAAGAPAAVLYGGDATSTASLTAGDVITTDLVAVAQRYIKANGWVSEPGRPFVLFVPAVGEEAFLKDSQFVNASEYGSNEIVANGEIGRYLGIRVIVTEQCPAATTWGGGALAGHTCFLLKAKVAYGIAYREQPTLDFEYLKDQAAYNIYLDMAFQCKVLQQNALVLIKVSDQ
jgi:N4-gp56 family major capsid protein